MNKSKLYFFLFALMLISFSANTQTRFDIGVNNGAGEMIMPWTGGYNAPQFSNIDFNHDDVTDLISFDRQGDILRTFVHLPASGRWVQSWAYESIFPKLFDWVQIADIDKDGIEDLFTGSSPTGVPGVTVYKGKFENEIWSFTLLRDRGKDYLQVPAGGGLTNLYVSWDDIPSISDIDNDGDLDILSFEPGGSYITYYKNLSVEMGWGTDSLRFDVADFCWGKILENELTEEVYLSDDPDVCSDGNFLSEDPILQRHSGSTVATLDFDYDGDKDAWVGDITSRHLVFLLNDLSPEEAWITAQEPRFPSTDTIIDLPYFVTAYFVELDDDPEPEMLAAVNSRALAEDRKSVWRYDDDIFTDGPLTFKFTEKGWLQNEMIDLGSHSRPSVADVNGDGLKDLVVGGYHYTEGSATRIPSLWYFKNIGTLSQPYFRLITNDYLSMSVFGSNPTFDFSPAFGDLDGDGSIDLVVGDQNGKLFYYHNAAVPGDSMIFETPIYGYMNINVGVSAAPQIVDINGDGLADLVIGERTGNADINGRCSNLNYFQNIGSVGAPFFNSNLNTSPNTACYGRVLFDLPIGLPQYSTPAIVRTDNGLVLMAGGDPGDLQLYGDLQAGMTGSLTVLDEDYGDLDMGHRSAPALADLDNDGYYELIVGNLRGGLELLTTGLKVGTTSITNPVVIDKPYSIINDIRNHTVEIMWKGEIGEALLFDSYGRLLQSIPHNQDYSIELEKYIPGIYFIRLTSNNMYWVEKVVRI